MIYGETAFDNRRNISIFEYKTFVDDKSYKNESSKNNYVVFKLFHSHYYVYIQQIIIIFDTHKNLETSLGW